MIFLIKDGMRMCRDNRWRSFANWGSTNTCVKTYRRLGVAKKRADRLKAKVVQITEDNITVEAGGRVYVTIPVSDTYHRIEDKNIEEFVVHDGTLPTVSAIAGTV